MAANWGDLLLRGAAKLDADRRVLVCCAMVALSCGRAKLREHSCPGTCPRPNPTRLEVLAGQPGGSGWVDGPLAAAHFNEPWALAGDPPSHVYVADLHVIRDIDVAAGTVTTLAGDHRRAGSEDGTGAHASFNDPCGLAFAKGQLYVADTENHTVRRVDVHTGEVTTIAGAAGAPGAIDAAGTLARFREPEGIALGAHDDLYVADTDNDTLRVLSLASGAVRTLAGSANAVGNSDGVGANARFSKPKGVALDASGNLYVIDSGNLSVRKVHTASGAVTTLATFKSLPRGLAVVGDDLLVSLAENRIVRVAPDATVRTVAGTASQGGFVDGPAEAAQFNAPAGLLLAASGTLYVADLGNSVVRALSLPDATTTTFAGARSSGHEDGAAPRARFSAPEGLVAEEGAVYVADSGNDTIRKIALPSGEVTTLAGAVGQPDFADGASGGARFNQPSAVALDSAARILYVADARNRRIRRIDLRTGQVTTLVVARVGGDGFDGFDAPSGLALVGDRLFVTDYAQHTVAAIDLRSGAGTTFAGTRGVPGHTDGVGTKASFYGPSGIASDGGGHLFVADDLNETVREIDVETARVTTVAGRPTIPGGSDGTGSDAHFHYPMGVASDGHGDVFVADSANNSVRRIDVSTGQVTTMLGSAEASGVRLGPLPAQLSKPVALGLTTAGGLLLTSENAVLLAR